MHSPAFFPIDFIPIDFPFEIDLTFSPKPILARFRLAFKQKKSKKVIPAFES